MKRFERLGRIRRMGPVADATEMLRLTAAYEFPWDFTRSLELALYRTYAVPSIGRLLAATAELTDRSQKRYDDTALLLDAVVEHGFGSDQARTAIRRVNQMHRSYDISDDDMRYVLCTFVVMPRHLDPRPARRTPAAGLPLRAPARVHPNTGTRSPAGPGACRAPAAAATEPALRAAEPGDQELSVRLPAGRPRHPSGPRRPRLPGASRRRFVRRRRRVTRTWGVAGRDRPGT